MNEPTAFRKVRLGLIGLGRWGANYARTIQATESVELYAISTRERRPFLCTDLFHTSNWMDLLEVSELDGIVIASSPEYHYEMASSFLAQGLPVILEKPACYSVAECRALMELSLQHGVPCVVGYTHLYSSAFRALKKRAHKVGPLTTITSTGVSNGPYRENVDVLWDWGSHEVAMCLDYLNEVPTDMSITLEEYEPTKPNACIYSLELRFPSGAYSSSRFGNTSSFKERTFWVCRGNGKLRYDGLDQTILEIDDDASRLIEYRQEPRPLANLVNEFAECIRNGTRYHWSIELAVEVTRVIATADSKLNQERVK